MRAEATAAQVQAYRDQGFVKIESLLDETELDHWRRTIAQVVAERTERIPGFGDGGGTGDDYYDKVFTQRVNLWRTHAAMRELVLDARLAGLAAKLEGLPAVRLWHDQAFFKGAWANATSWHLDDPYWSFHSRHATSLWIALDDTTMQNGALYFLPGTHRTARYDNVLIGHNVGALFDVYPEWRQIEPVCLELKAGDASFHNGLTAHAAGPNMTPSSRRGFDIIYMPEGSTFNGQRNVLPKELFDALRPGDRLANDDFNPVVFPSTSA